MVLYKYMLPFFRQKNRRKPAPRPSWVKWLLLAFIGYAFVMYSVPQPNKTKHTIEQAKEEIEKNDTLKLSEYKNKIFPEHAAGLRINDVKPGEGAAAVCGQTVEVSYQSYLAQGNALPDAASKEKPLRFTIGSGNVMPVFDRGVIGMKQGGARSIIAPPLMSYGLSDYKRDDVPEGASVRFEMELLSIEPKLPDLAVMPYRIAEVAVGKGSMVLCGEEALLGITIWDVTGKKLYQSDEPLKITPGKNQAMLGLEQGAIGMLTGGIRLLIIPPAFQKTLAGDKPTIDFPLPENQTVMVEVKAYTP